MVRKLTLGIAVITMLVLTASATLAQSGHFLTGGGKAPTCTDNGTTLSCTATVAGLGGTTFRLEVSATAVASVECTNPGGNVAPGQSFTAPATGSTGDEPTPRNGRATVTVETASLSAPANSCPNDKWTASIVDVAFSNITLTLYENGTPSDTFQVS
jgi:hypothetical protein